MNGSSPRSSARHLVMVTLPRTTIYWATHPEPVQIGRCIIPAAGLGTRFLPATKSMPKEMLPAIDRPVIQYVVEEALLGGLDQILIVTGRGKRAIEDHFDHSAELEAATVELEGEDGPLLEEDAESVGELDLAVLAGRGLLDRPEDVGREGVGAHDAKVGGGVSGVGFLDEVADAVDAGGVGGVPGELGSGSRKGHDAVILDLRRADPLDGYHGVADGLEGFYELAGGRFP